MPNIGRPPPDGPVAPVAFRPLGTFPPRRTSVFEDPGDERSWHVSQVFESLMRFYEGREPQWYASAVKELAGSESVVELGSGPSLALRALREMGVRSVLGLDRWPGFAELGREHGVPVLLHDLTLPAPFLRSGAVEAVFSHYVLDYMSPIGVRQALREARRILRPGGRAVLLLAALGLAGGDEARTVRYTPEAMLKLTADAGFQNVSAQAPGERNTVVEARLDPDEQAAPSDIARGAAGATVGVHGEAQLSVGFAAEARTVTVELTGGSWRYRYELELGSHAARSADPAAVNPAAATARLQRVARNTWELQLCAWLHGVPVHASAVRVGTPPREITVTCAAPIEHAEAWSPQPLALDETCAVHLGDGPAPATGMVLASEPVRGRLEPLTALDLRGRADAGTAGLDAAWLQGTFHAIAVDVERLRAGDPILGWAASRSAIMLVQTDGWERGIAAARAAAITSPPPIVLLDPALGDAPNGPGAPTSVLSAARTLPHVYLGLTDQAAAFGRPPLEPDDPVVRVSGSGARPPTSPGPAENLRYLCERALLMRLRATSGRSPAEVGRLPPLETARYG
jgi:SAM-dependent methyltransferase